jgi:hypothetical protein
MRLFAVCAVLAVFVLALSAGVSADNGASTTRATLPSGYVDENNVAYPATCDYTQVINDNHRTETFRCTFDGAVPAPVVCDTSIGCLWFSDFDGAQATDTHFVINPGGFMVGWAQY